MTEAVKKELRILLVNVDTAFGEKETELNEIRDEQEGFPESPLEVMERQLSQESMSNSPEKSLINRISRLQNTRKRIDTWSARIRADMLLDNSFEQHYLSEAGKDANEFIEAIEGI